MNLSPFANLPDNTRIWIYGFRAPLSAEQQRTVSDHLLGFLPEWNAHGTPVHGAFAILEDRFLLLAGHCADGISGCSIDSSVRVMKELRERHSIDGLDTAVIFHRSADGAIASHRRDEFRILVDRGAVRADTPVFDTSLTELSQIRSGAFERPFAESWHARVFGRSAAIA